MDKKILKFIVIILLISFNSLTAQIALEKQVQIKGVVSENRAHDTIVFSNGAIDPKFYETRILTSEVKEGNFNMDASMSYPQLYTLSYTSEKGNIVSHGGDYFIDGTTRSITVDSIVGCSELDGKTFLEYRNKFLPFFLGNEATCKLSIIAVIYRRDVHFSEKLLKYTQENPNSFVALWTLISVVNDNGHSLIFESVLDAFSDQMKKNKLWTLAKEDLSLIRIKEKGKFPELNLKDRQQVGVQLQLPKAKYTLIDYWFYNCRPCLENFPKMKELYKTYKSKGFEVIGISVDRTKNISKWKERINEYELEWTNYWDENGLEAAKDKIFTFPTTYLLDENGRIIGKNFALLEIEEILKNNL